jgi:hypothetical protein
MVAHFQYRPKFVDIRVNKPDEDGAPRAPVERRCDHVGCVRAGECRAPKRRDARDEFWWFCVEHAADYNRRWNFFEGMSDSELRAYEESERIGHRPTWTFRPSAADREASIARKFHAFRGEAAHPFTGAAAPPPRRRLSRLQVMALETLGLEEGAEPAAVRARYAELVKRYHPDSNGGDRSAEAHLHKVIRAYQALKSTGLG